jgi:hypothetical protein
MSMEETEQAAYNALYTNLPTAIATENAKYSPSDPNLIPSIATWTRGLIVQFQDVNTSTFPIIVVGCYRDIPLHDEMGAEGDFGEWGAEMERPVVCLVSVTAGTEAGVHIRLVRLINAIKNVWRAEAQGRLGNTVKYWPLDLDVEFDEPAPLPLVNGVAWFQTAKIEAKRCVVIEGVQS